MPSELAPKSAVKLSDAGEEHMKRCIALLRKTGWFMYCSEEHLRLVASLMQKEHYHEGDVIIREQQKHTKMYVVSSGMVDRVREIDGRRQLMDIEEEGNTIGAYYIMKNQPCYSDAICKTDVECYAIKGDALLPLFQDPSFAREVAYNLNVEIRRHIRAAVRFKRTPLLEQEAKETPYGAISIAASIESFYRSAMNAGINAALSGQSRVPAGALFPNMHLQVPTRVAYINGFKGVRHAVDNSYYIKNIEEQSNPFMIRLLAAITPGLCMTPVSSMLEAFNAGHLNPEPLQTRWMRGVMPRGVREIIFGVGLNQLSDYCEERADVVSHNPTIRNAVGSITAGIIAGYFSHVPHNISTLKILYPHKSYWEILREYVAKGEERLPQDLSPRMRRVMSAGISLLAPRGLMIRTAQIVGSFIILNGTIHALEGRFKNDVKIVDTDSESMLRHSVIKVNPEATLMHYVKALRNLAADEE